MEKSTKNVSLKDNIDYFDTWIQHNSEDGSCIRDCWNKLRSNLLYPDTPKCTNCGRPMYNYCSVCDGSVHRY